MIPRKARDLAVLDNVDAFVRQPFTGAVWRIVREGRDPLQGGPSNSRWCNGGFDVLYTCLERDGAIAEIYSLLSSQPVFPSKIQSFMHKLHVSVDESLVLADHGDLAKLGVDVSRYRERDYSKTQILADAAYFLGFDGLVVPSARWACQNVVLFTDRIDPSALSISQSEAEPVDWELWRRERARWMRG